MRAETIKSYLIDNGVDKKRVDTYGWGGTIMLVQPGTAAATRLNNRMEIEVTQD
jgi:outer membrane protein OmpA-like peptidoglycan-associated protein